MRDRLKHTVAYCHHECQNDCVFFDLSSSVQIHKSLPERDSSSPPMRYSSPLAVAKPRLCLGEGRGPVAWFVRSVQARSGVERSRAKKSS
jgi:hypothetical protein